MLFVLMLWALGGLIGYAAAEKRGFHKLVGVLCGLVLGPVFAPVMFVVSGVARQNDFRDGVGPTPPARPRRNPVTVGLVALNIVLGLIAVALVIVRLG